MQLWSYYLWAVVEWKLSSETGEVWFDLWYVSVQSRNWALSLSLSFSPSLFLSFSLSLSLDVVATRRWSRKEIRSSRIKTSWFVHLETNHRVGTCLNDAGTLQRFSTEPLSKAIKLDRVKWGVVRLKAVIWILMSEWIISLSPVKDFTGWITERKRKKKLKEDENPDWNWHSSATYIYFFLFIFAHWLWFDSKSS